MTEATSLTLSELKPKMELQGVVKKVQLAGAVIDLGNDIEGLLHISQIKQDRKKGQSANSAEAIQEGAEITVWVRSVDVEKERVALTMFRPPAVDWSDLVVGQTFQGTVIRIKKFGVFVDIGAARPGLVHISELSNEYVEKPGDVVSRGQEVEVKVIGVDKNKEQIDLSIKALLAIDNGREEIVDEVEEEEPKEVMTAMAMALQKAMDGQETSEDKSKKSRKADKKSQEDIFQRTLEHHSES